MNYFPDMQELVISRYFRQNLDYGNKRKVVTFNKRRLKEYKKPIFRKHSKCYFGGFTEEDTEKSVNISNTMCSMFHSFTKKTIPKLININTHFYNPNDSENISSEFKIPQNEILINKSEPNLPHCLLVKDFEVEYFSGKLKTESMINITQFEWIPPKSPHNLIEEVLYHDPWALLVATIFLNKTSCAVARPYIFWFLVENPNPLSVMNMIPKDLEKYFINLGLTKTRAVQIWRMTFDYLFKEWRSPKDLYGIGDYGDCAYRMFCLGDFNVEPNDRFLRIYKAWYQKVIKKK